MVASNNGSFKTSSSSTTTVHTVSTAPPPKVPAYSIPKPSTTKPSSGGSSSSTPVFTVTPQPISIKPSSGGGSSSTSVFKVTPQPQSNNITQPKPTTNTQIKTEKVILNVGPKIENLPTTVVANAAKTYAQRQAESGFANRSFKGELGTAVKTKSGEVAYGGTVGHAIGDALPSTRQQTYGISGSMAGMKLADTERVYVANAPSGVDPWMTPLEAYNKPYASPEVKAEATDKYNAMINQTYPSVEQARARTEAIRSYKQGTNYKPFEPIISSPQTKIETVSLLGKKDSSGNNLQSFWSYDNKQNIFGGLLPTTAGDPNMVTIKSTRTDITAPPINGPFKTGGLLPPTIGDPYSVSSGENMVTSGTTRFAKYVGVPLTPISSIQQIGKKVTIGAASGVEKGFSIYPKIATGGVKIGEKVLGKTFGFMGNTAVSMFDTTIKSGKAVNKFATSIPAPQSNFTWGTSTPASSYATAGGNKKANSFDNWFSAKVKGGGI